MHLKYFSTSQGHYKSINQLTVDLSWIIRSYYEQ